MKSNKLLHYVSLFVQGAELDLIVWVFINFYEVQNSVTSIYTIMRHEYKGNSSKFI